MQRDVGIEVAEDVSQLLLGHNGELQHWVMVRLWTGEEPKLSNNNLPFDQEGVDFKNSSVKSFRGTQERYKK